MGHLLEHVDWGHVTTFLADRVTPALVDDGELAIVGPDVYRAIHGWHNGANDWDWVVATLEDCDAQFDLQGEPTDNATEGWPEARHKWNAYEDRVFRVVQLALPDWNVRAVPIAEEYLREYPVVAYTHYQCAVIASRR